MDLWPEPSPRRSLLERVTVPGLAGALVLLASALFVSSCFFVTHVTCRGGHEGACAIDNYGLAVKVAHVDLPAREIVEVVVDERVGRRGNSSARVTVVTKTMGRIDLSGDNRIVSTYAVSDAVLAASALRQMSPRGQAPRDVDLWAGPSPVAMLFVVFFAVLLWAGLIALIRGFLRDEP